MFQQEVHEILARWITCFCLFFSFLPIACFFFGTHTLLLLLFIVYFIFPTNYAKEIPCENLQITNNIESFKVL